MRQWLDRAQSQGGKHLLPLLALLERGAGNGVSVHFEERPDEYAFWDRYFRLPGDDAKPYFNVLTGRRAEANFPHSNAATIRKNRFWRAWHAATLETESGPDGDESWWTLAIGYATIFEAKALSKGGVISRVPVVDLAAVLFRGEEFEDEATALTVAQRFRERFPQSNADHDTVFEFADENANHLFTTTQPSAADYDLQIESALVPDIASTFDRSTSGAVGSSTGVSIGPVAPPPLQDEDDLVLLHVRELLALGSSGIILRGVPGTGKTWYGRRIGAKLVANSATDLFRVQFHPSYGYEDFVEGYKPDTAAGAGFSIVDKTFLLACERANAVAAEGGLVVVLVDEINRGDPGRIFGELLTYVEVSYRNEKFFLPYSGREAWVPSNLVILGTMNPFDRSITQLDAALVRRFDHIDIPPSSEAVAMFLEEHGGFAAEQVTRVCQWFDTLQRLLPQGIGHTYFKDVRRPEHLQIVWRYRMKPACEAALEFDPRTLANIHASFEAMYTDVLAIGSPVEPEAPQASENGAGTEVP